VISDYYLKLKEMLPEAQRNVLMKEHTSYKIGGPAKYFFIARDKEGLISALEVAKDLNIPVYAIGGGSNILFSDKGYKGLVVKMNIDDTIFNGNMAKAGAGAGLSKLAYLAADKGLSGLEWSAGIPSATVGGAIYGNAQAFDVKMSDTVKNVEALNLKTLKMKTFSKKQCQFSLKNSIFKKKKNLVVISVILEFTKKDKKEIKKTIEQFLSYRKKGHPLKFFSAGSVFINPELEIKDKKLLEKYPEFLKFNEAGIIPAGFLIQKSGLAGKKIGDAKISELHCNFIVNLGRANAKDVISLIKLAQKKVKNNFGIHLETEIQFVGF